MKPEHREILLSTFSRVTEGFAFMFMRLPREKEAFPRGDAPFVQSSTGFSGKLQGAMSIVAPEALVLALAKNTLGEEEEEEGGTDDPADGLNELMNIVCGETVRALEEEEATFSLLVPQSNAITQAQWDTLLMNEQWMRCLIDTYPVLITLRVQE